MRRFIGVSILVLLTAVHADAQEARLHIDVSKLGPQVGDRVPDFKLFDQDGRQQTLQSIMGRRGAMLVFIRSADWCPYCKTQLVELQSRVSELQAQGLGLASISYDSREVLAAFARQHGITFPMLSDPGSETIKRYGILNTIVAEAFGPNRDDPAVRQAVRQFVSEVNPTPNMAGIPFPGTFIVDRQGRVTSRFFEDFYAERSTVSSLLKRLGAGGNTVSATKVSTEHLELTTYLTDAAVAPGNRFAVVLDVVPKRGMHVYAPGAANYRVVSMKLEEAAMLRLLPLRYPPSEIYHFKPLKERVPVYRKPFTLVQEVILQGDRASQSQYRGKEVLTISGTLEYQACDDRICYNPVALPLTWTVKLRPLVFERPTRTQ